MEPCTLIVGTEDGVATLRWDGDRVTDLVDAPAGGTVREFSAHPENPDDVLAACGLRGWGLHRSTDGGDTWTEVGFGDEWVWGVTRDPTDPETVYVGTEPPALYRSRDGGGTWTDVSDFDDLPTRDRWTFFHDPFEAGHVHGISVDPDDASRVYAGVEHGALVYTHNGGDTWQDALPGHDLHDTAVFGDVVLASAGEGLFLSANGGDTWEEQGLADWYVKDLLVAPDRERVYVDAARGSANTEAAVWVSADGRDWERVPGAPNVGVTGCCLLAVAPDDTLLHVAGDADSGYVVAYEDGAWRRVGPTLDVQVRALTATP